MKFSKFMSSAFGRTLRVIAGVTLIIVGLIMKSTGGYILAVVGVIPLAAGLFDFCLIAKILKMPFSGKQIRAL